MDNGKTVEDAMKAADACAARPPEKKRLGPMFGWALEILASEVRALRERDRGHARVCPQHVKNIDPWVRESALLAKQKQSDSFEEAWKEELAKNAVMKKQIIELRTLVADILRPAEDRYIIGKCVGDEEQLRLWTKRALEVMAPGKCWDRTPALREGE